ARPGSIGLRTICPRWRIHDLALLIPFVFMRLSGAHGRIRGSADGPFPVKDDAAPDFRHPLAKDFSAARLSPGAGTAYSAGRTGLGGHGLVHEQAPTQWRRIDVPGLQGHACPRGTWNREPA